MKVELKASSENLTSIQVFPTPLSPIKSNLNRKSYVFAIAKPSYKQSGAKWPQEKEGAHPKSVLLDNRLSQLPFKSAVHLWARCSTDVLPRLFASLHRFNSTWKSTSVFDILHQHFFWWASQSHVHTCDVIIRHAHATKVQSSKCTCT